LTVKLNKKIRREYAKHTMKTTQAIAQSIKLVTMETGAWRAQKLNRKESKDVNSRHATTDAAKVIVRLTDNPHLTALYKLHAEAYAEHRRITLPSIQDGIRIVPCGKELEHSRVMADFAQKHDALLADFLAEYDAIRLEAPVKLNGLFDGKQWPSKDVVAGKFKFQTRYLPCPADGDWGSWLEEAAQAGQSELRERLVTAARHLAKVCKGDGKLYQSALDNLREVCELAGDGFNLLDDPIIAQAARELIQHGNQKAESLRDIPAARKDTSEKVSSILATLNLA
jgi:hypothetical protein